MHCSSVALTYQTFSHLGGFLFFFYSVKAVGCWILSAALRTIQKIFSSGYLAQLKRPRAETFFPQQNQNIWKSHVYCLVLIIDPPFFF